MNTLAVVHNFQLTEIFRFRAEIIKEKKEEEEINSNRNNESRRAHKLNENL